MSFKPYEYWKGLPGWAKGVVGVAAAGIAVFVSYKVYKIFVKTDNEKRNAELSRNIDNEIANKQQAGQKPSFEESQYDTFANTIYEGMRYAVGDDYGTVEETMEKMNNDVDVAKLIKAFGFRQDYSFGIPTGEPKDLFTFVNSELGDDWFGITNYRVTRINSQWKAKGITYQL